MRISDWSSDVCSSDLGITSDVAAKALASPVVAAPGGSAAAASTTTATGVPLRLTGLVTAATSSGQPIVHTPLGTLTLDTRAVLPAGTSLALEIVLPQIGRAHV